MDPACGKHRFKMHLKSQKQYVHYLSLVILKGKNGGTDSAVPLFDPSNKHLLLVVWNKILSLLGTG